MRAKDTIKKKMRGDEVWVDCFFYGFYIDKSKLPAFQQGLLYHYDKYMHFRERQSALGGAPAPERGSYQSISEALKLKRTKPSFFSGLDNIVDSGAGVKRCREFDGAV